jgi:hypothetical protein
MDDRRPIQLLPPGTDDHLEAIGALFALTNVTGDMGFAMEGFMAAQSSKMVVRCSGPSAEALYNIVSTLAMSGQRAEADRFLALLDDALARAPSPSIDPAFLGWRLVARAARALLDDAGPVTVGAFRTAAAEFERAGHMHGFGYSLSLLVLWHGCMGAPSALASLDRLESSGANVGILRSFANLGAASLHCSSGRHREARDAFAHEASNPNAFTAATGHWGHAVCSLRAGDLVEAESEAVRCMDRAGSIQVFVQMSSAVLTAARLLRGDARGALEEADRALSAQTTWLALSLLHLTRAEALHALGRVDEARNAIRSARDRVLRIAGELEHEDLPDLRQPWLENVPENARTLKLAREWLGT